ncbi:DUF2071 domain-containing protein [Halorussus amylolyticus]|uniref:DUF2071 domain-containing protein n=1 Tax=Halorussus amylolyticus TaxID=1126242 RepID=UPI00104E9C69
MGWRHVLFVNCPVDSDLLKAHLPSTFTVDTYDGDACLSVVPFTNVDGRPTWAPEGWELPNPGRLRHSRTAHLANLSNEVWWVGARGSWH